MFVQVKHCLYTLETFVLSFYLIKITIHGILNFINIKVCKMSQLFHAKQISKFLLGYIITQLRTYKRYFYRMSRCLLRKQLFFPTVLYRLMWRLCWDMFLFTFKVSSCLWVQYESRSDPEFLYTFILVKKYLIPQMYRIILYMDALLSHV